MWRAEEKSQLVPVSPSRCCCVMQSAQDRMKHSTFFFLHGNYEEKKKEKRYSYCSETCSFEAGQEGFYWMKYTATPFKFARDFEGAVGMRSEDKCLTNMKNRGCAGWVLLKPLLLWLLERAP